MSRQYLLSRKRKIEEAAAAAEEEEEEDDTDATTVTPRGVIDIRPRPPSVASSLTAPTTKKKAKKSSKPIVRPALFPQRLYAMLQNVDTQRKYSHILTWSSDGRSFWIDTKNNADADIVKAFNENHFHLKQVKSFLKQMVVYNFQRLYKGHYAHAFFVRDRPELFANKTIQDFQRYTNHNKIHHHLPVNYYYPESTFPRQPLGVLPHLHQQAAAASCDDDKDANDADNDASHRNSVASSGDNEDEDHEEEDHDDDNDDASTDTESFGDHDDAEDEKDDEEDAFYSCVSSQDGTVDVAEYPPGRGRRGGMIQANTNITTDSEAGSQQDSILVPSTTSTTTTTTTAAAAAINKDTRSTIPLELPLVPVRGMIPDDDNPCFHRRHVIPTAIPPVSRGDSGGMIPVEDYTPPTTMRRGGMVLMEDNDDNEDGDRCPKLPKPRVPAAVRRGMIALDDDNGDDDKATAAAAVRAAVHHRYRVLVEQQDAEYQRRVVQRQALHDQAEELFEQAIAFDATTTTSTSDTETIKEDRIAVQLTLFQDALNLCQTSMRMLQHETDEIDENFGVDAAETMPTAATAVVTTTDLYDRHGHNVAVAVGGNSTRRARRRQKELFSANIYHHRAILHYTLGNYIKCCDDCDAAIAIASTRVEAARGEGGGRPQSSRSEDENNTIIAQDYFKTPGRNQAVLPVSSSTAASRGNSTGSMHPQHERRRRHQSSYKQHHLYLLKAKALAGLERYEEASNWLLHPSNVPYKQLCRDGSEALLASIQRIGMMYKALGKVQHSSGGGCDRLRLPSSFPTATATTMTTDNSNHDAASLPIASSNHRLPEVILQNVRHRLRAQYANTTIKTAVPPAPLTTPTTTTTAAPMVPTVSLNNSLNSTTFSGNGATPVQLLRRHGPVLSQNSLQF